MHPPRRHTTGRAAKPVYFRSLLGDVGGEDALPQQGLLAGFAVSSSARRSAALASPGRPSSRRNSARVAW